MNPKRVVIVGGSGFIGSAIANRLCKEGVKVLIPTRRRSRAGHVLLLPNVEVVEGNVHDVALLARLFEGADAVVNTVGVLHSRPGRPFGPDFARAHVELPQKIVAACRTAGVPRLVHISALGAYSDGPSEYQRSKAAGETAIRTGSPEIAWTILQPSVVFGRGDSFLNLFADLARMFPVLPLAGATARFQPARRVRLRARGQAAPDLSAVREAGDVAGAPHGARPPAPDEPRQRALDEGRQRRQRHPATLRHGAYRARDRGPGLARPGGAASPLLPLPPPRAALKSNSLRSPR